jgi:hypothetical protein
MKYLLETCVISELVKKEPRSAGKTPSPLEPLSPGLIFQCSLEKNLWTFHEFLTITRYKLQFRGSGFSDEQD